jgi:hypothetical protein
MHAGDIVAPEHASRAERVEHKYVTLFTEELSWWHGAGLDLVMGQAFCDWIGGQTSGS